MSIKKGSLDLPIHYILLLVVFAGVLLFGYQAIRSTGDKSDQTEIVLFQTALERDISSMAFGDVREKSYAVPSTVEKICFTDSVTCNPLLQPPCSDASEHPLIADAVGSNDNVHIVADGAPTSARIDGVVTACCGQFLCVPNSGGKLELRLEGQGDVTTVAAT